MSVTDAAAGDGDGDGPAGISEADGAADSVGESVGVSESGLGVAGTRASGKHAVAMTLIAALMT
jgi:hypothetical protein